MNTIERATDKINETAYCVAAALQVAVADRRERGATAVEYALMVGLLALVIVGGVSVFRSKLSNMYITYASTLPG
jgi:pilus assembly protein Flp/PilA